MNHNSASDDDMSISEEKVKKALAALIKNTRITSRPLSLVEIEKWLRIAIQGVGSVSEVANRIDLSPKMLRQFQAVNKLSDSVKKLFASRKIDSVDAAVHLTRFSKKDQLIIANELSSSLIDTFDLRAIWDIRKRNPKMGIKNLIKNIKESRNIKHYIAEFVIRGGVDEIEVIPKRFEKVFGIEKIVSFSLRGALGKIVFNKSGKKRLQEICHETNMTKLQVITMIGQGDSF